MALSIASARVDAPAAWYDAGSAGDGFSRAESVFLIGSRTWRLRIALLVSLLVHALLLSLSLGGDGSWLPGLRFPWEERRLAARDLQIVLAPAQHAAEERGTAPLSAPPPMPAAAPEAAQVLAPGPAAVRAPPPEPVVAIARKADRQASATLQGTPAVVAPEGPVANVESAQQAQRIAQAAQAAQAEQEAARQEQLQRDSALAAQAALEQAARRDAESREQARQEILRQESLRQENARVSELARQEAARREQERAESAQLEAARQEQARQEQARQVRTREEALRQEQARLAELARQEAARQELERAEAARQDAIRQEAARQAAVRQEAARQEAARQEQAQRELAQREAAQREAAQQAQAQQERAAQEAKREERLRAIGRQLDQEAGQRDAANAAPGTLPATSGLRRGWLLGRADPNRDLILYAEAMARKIELNPTTIAMVRELVKQPHVRPAVTVAVRADGSVERVTFAVSSNVPAIDDAIRKVVASQAPYGPFPPALARQYDVVEIRRTWIFDVAIRLE